MSSKNNSDQGEKHQGDNRREGPATRRNNTTDRREPGRVADDTAPRRQTDSNDRRSTSD